ncbi:MAG: sialate O-acetylesterase [Verrucomicrobiota bacterium]
MVVREVLKSGWVGLASVLVLFGGFGAEGQEANGPEPSAAADGKPVRLFLLSGQSNMVHLNPEDRFTPALKKAFPDEEIIVAKFAKSGRAIRSWVPTWKSTKPGDKAKGGKAFYVKLIREAEAALAGRAPKSVTFVWMQGERDAREGYGAEYGPALEGLLGQLRETYGREDIDFVLGRLSDHGLDKADEFPGWKGVRQAQEEFVAADPQRRVWVDTDNFNQTGDGLHYDEAGRKALGERFAEESIRLIETDSAQSTAVR